MLRGRNLLFTALALFASSLTASAGTFQVDTTVDSPSVAPGDGKCVSKAGGCSLRAAVEEANATSLASTISIPSGTYTLSIPPEGQDFAKSGSLFLRGEITLSGEDFIDTIIDGGRVDRVFQIAKDSTIELSGVTIRNGEAKGGDGGGMLNRGHLKMRNVVFSQNRATADPGQANGSGGALRNDADANLENVTFDGNQADGRGGGLYNTTDGSLQMRNGRLTSNSSLTDDGGAVLNEGKLSLGILVVRRNRAANGAGIDNVDGDLTLFDLLVADNVAGSNGGGLRNSGQAKLTNVTVGANQAGGAGGAIDNRAKGTLALNNVTIVRNRATEAAGGIQNATDATVEIGNTIVARNNVAGKPVDCAGVLHSHGYNLLGAEVGCTLTGDLSGNVLDEAPGVDKLARNGGGSPTYALAGTSPAVDAGNPAPPTGSDGSCAPADQRGVKRPQAGKAGGPPRCDIGAFELKPGA